MPGSSEYDALRRGPQDPAASALVALGPMTRSHLTSPMVRPASPRCSWGQQQVSLRTCCWGRWMAGRWVLAPVWVHGPLTDSAAGHGGGGGQRVVLFQGVGTELGRKAGPLHPSWLAAWLQSPRPPFTWNAWKVHHVEHSAVMCFLPFLTGSASSVKTITLERTWCLEREGSEKRQPPAFSGLDVGPPSLQVPWSQTHRPGGRHFGPQQSMTGKQPTACCPGLALGVHLSVGQPCWLWPSLVILYGAGGCMRWLWAD